ncbi:MAG: DUF4249 domain-containing protein [Bacteroidales bacterium]|nr:DUF4249 domain-containing protein [Bacteroidales bacterium]
MKIKPCVLLLSGIIVLAACSEKLDIDREYTRKLVANCILCPDTVQVLTLAYNSTVGSSVFDKVSDAEAVLYCENEAVGKFTKGKQDWELKYTPEAGKEYRLEVRVPGEPVLTATTTMPEKIAIERMKSGKDRAFRRLFQQAKPGPAFWIFCFTVNTDTQDYVRRNPKAGPEDYMQSSIGSNHPYADSFNAGTDIMFSTSSYVAGTTREHQHYVRIAPTYNHEGYIDFCIEGYLLFSFIYFRSASEEYDKYLKSSLKRAMAMIDTDDPTSWFDETEVFCNIENGLGIFGAYNDYVLQYNTLIDHYIETLNLPVSRIFDTPGLQEWIID